YAIMRGNPRRVRAPPATDYARRSRAPSTRSCAGTLEGFAPLPRQTTPGEAGLRLRDHAREPSKGSRPLPRQTTPGEAGLRLRDHAREPSKGSRPLPRQTTPGEAGLRLRDHAREPSKGSRPLPRQTTPGEAGLRLRDHHEILSRFDGRPLGAADGRHTPGAG